MHEPDAPITQAYFPLEGIVSLVLTAADGTTVEAGLVGNEGALGTPLALGTDRAPTKAFFQTPGEAYRMSAAQLRAEIERGGALPIILRRYMHAMTMQLAQSVFCNRVHSIEERLARWILLTHDRVAGDELQLTQEFAAQMLAVRRPSVTVVASLLQQAGLIRYVRGRIHVLDRARLEDASCECYGVVRQQLEIALSFPPE